MCGICGTAGFVDEELLQSMTDCLAHRGPDGQGVRIFQSPQSAYAVGLGHRRLAIIDLSSSGGQPMCNEDGTVWITYNGEIYNFPALRAQLVRKGHRFRSKTDTEVVIHLYEEHRHFLLKLLNGMFAFALWDDRAKRLLLARDPLGIKPLYYAHLGNCLIFASEVKALLLVDGVERSIDFEALHAYVSFGWVPGPKTMFDGIYKLMPGHYLVWEEGRSSVHQYWDMRPVADGQREESYYRDRLRHLLTESVRRHMISDVPLGVCLSGGVDSSSILGLMSQMVERPVTAFTIRYRQQDARLEQSDEDPRYARLVASQFGADLHEILLEPKVADLLPKLIWHMDEPVADPAPVSQYLICQVARPTLTVLLSGMGADELLAGYHSFLFHRLSEYFRIIPPVLRGGPLTAVIEWLLLLKDGAPGVPPGLILAIHRNLRKMAQGASLSPQDRFIFYRANYLPQEQFTLYAPQLRDSLRRRDSASAYKSLFEMVSDADFLSQMLYVETKTFLPELNLTYSDKMSMACSVEVRVPFLDAELVDFIATIPSSLKLKGMNGKYILKKAMEDILPQGVLRRRKAAFGSPIRAWLRHDLRGMVGDLLSERAVRERGLFEPRIVSRLISENLSGSVDNTSRIWSLLTLELWCRAFID